MDTITKSEKENYLEAMYLLKCSGDKITKTALEKRMQASAYRVNCIVEQLIEEGYLFKDEKKHLFLTTIGLHKGRGYAEKHRCLTECLMLLSGVEQELAEENACRIAHSMDEKVYLGIQHFIESRNIVSNAMRHKDLKNLFPYGERELPAAVCRQESRYAESETEEKRKFISYIETCKPTMFQLQCLKGLKEQKERGSVCNEAEIARRLSVNRSTVSRCLRHSVEVGILLEDGYDFTKKGMEILEYYRAVEEELFDYFKMLGVEEEAQYQAVSGMLDAVDIKTIQLICEWGNMQKKIVHF